MTRIKTVIDDGERHSIKYFDTIEQAIDHCVSVGDKHFVHIMWGNYEDLV